MDSFLNILILTSDHSLFTLHMREVWPTLTKFWILEWAKHTFSNIPPFKISLAVLYSIVCIWGLTGNILKHLSLLLLFFGY